MTVGTQTIADNTNVVSYTNTSTDDNEEVIVTADVSKHDTFMLLSTAGVVDVLVSLDGTNFSTAPIALQDMGASTLDPVLVTVAGRVYGFRGKFRKIKVLQNGATDAAVTLLCGKMPSAA